MSLEISSAFNCNKLQSHGVLLHAAEIGSQIKRKKERKKENPDTKLLALEHRFIRK
jgi:hypothetical protein